MSLHGASPIFSDASQQKARNPKRIFMSEQPKTDTLIRNHVLLAAGGGLIPILLVDIAAVTAIQLDMLQKLCQLYGLNFSRSMGRGFIAALSSSVLARLGASLIKAIPGVGSFIGGLSSAILSGAATYAVGQVFVAHFEKGGTLEDFDPLSYKEIYEEQFEEGKRKTRNWQQKENDKKDQTIEIEASSQEEKLAKLKDLATLKEEGVISEAEFEEMKRKIMEEF